MKLDYILTIGTKEFRLTEKEKNYYLEAVNRGAKYVEIRGMFLGTSFLSLTHKKSLEGKWMCEKGVWHSNGFDCTCGVEFITEGNTIKMLSKEH